MGRTKYDFCALLYTGIVVSADNEEELNKKVTKQTVVLSYHREEDDIRDDKDEIVIDKWDKTLQVSFKNVPADVCKKIGI